MKHYEFADTFRSLYDKAVKLYGSGNTDSSTYFTADEQAFLSANGLTVQNLFDYAEDHHGYGEPGYDRALAIELVRRDYFLNAQGGKPSSTAIDVAKMPAKTDAVKGIEWLPRLIPKAKAKLRGELPSSLMYSCGGDRNFFRKHDIHPAEFLTLVWRNLDNDAATIDWVAQRAAGK
ncbi:MAG TPA: DUF5069 domain-containing protein [Lacunisphaera sp.]|nr:DUF5069 domain-containing protein [Lacunisphaera sp.]